MPEILLYGVIGDPFAGLDAATLVPQITSGNGPLSIRINSGGGYVVEGLAIYNAIARQVEAGRAVTVFIDGLAASMASVVAMAGSEIIMADNALLMIHKPMNFAAGNAHELRGTADVLDKLEEQILGIYAKRTGLSADTLTAMLAAETWIDSATALDLKFITSIGVSLKAVACVDVSKFGFLKVPEHPLVSASNSLAAAAVITKEQVMPEATQAAATQPAVSAVAAVAPALATPAITATDVSSAASAAVAAERTRISEITALTTKHGIDAETATSLITAGASVADARAQVLDVLATRADAANIGHNPRIMFGSDARDKWMQGAANAILLRSGQASIVAAAAKKRGEVVDMDPGEFRGVNLIQLATESLLRSGAPLNSRNPEAIVGAAFTARNAVTQGSGDFSTLLENTMNKVLQAAYAVTPDTWSRFCGVGSVTDFRAAKRYMIGSFGALDTVNELGEFKNKAIPDGGKESITATTKGNIISLTRQAIINDDLGAFIGLAAQLGRAAKLSIELDVYALIVANPTMNDGIALFHASHGNLISATYNTAPTVAAVDYMRVLMASQTDVSGNEVLDLKPAYAVLPVGLGGAMRVVNSAQYDPTASSTATKPNIALGVFSDIVDTARLTGTAYYAFADKDTAPAIEVAFLNGMMEPFTDSDQAWRTDGTEWKVRHDYGVAAVNWRGAVKNNGA